MRSQEFGCIFMYTYFIGISPPEKFRVGIRDQKASISNWEDTTSTSYLLRYIIRADLLVLETSELLVAADPKPEAIARHCHVQTLPADSTP